MPNCYERVDQLRRIADQLHALAGELSQDFTNHHNALACPYCNPKGLKLINPELSTIIYKWIQDARLFVEHNSLANHDDIIKALGKDLYAHGLDLLKRIREDKLV